MAYGINRNGKQTRAHFQRIGGTLVKFRHPYFTAQIDTETTGASKIDEIDVSAAVRQQGEFLRATQSEDSAVQTRLIDGSVVTITNRFLNGVLNLSAVKTTGLIGSGDLIAACQLIKSIGDTVGGLLTVTEFINGKAITTLFYGVTVKSCPDMILVGNDVAEYPIELYYAGWLQGIGTNSDDNLTKIWAVGNQKGLSAYFKPYSVNETGTEENVANSANTNNTFDSSTDTTASTDNYDLDTEQANVIGSSTSSAYTDQVSDAEEIAPAATGS